MLLLELHIRGLRVPVLASGDNQLGIGAVGIMESKGVGREEGGCWKLEGWNMNPLPCLQLRLITLLQVG